jgi:hypothetical protein
MRSTMRDYVGADLLCLLARGHNARQRPQDAERLFRAAADVDADARPRS